MQASTDKCRRNSRLEVVRPRLSHAQPSLGNRTVSAQKWPSRLTAVKHCYRLHRGHLCFEHISNCIPVAPETLPSVCRFPVKDLFSTGEWVPPITRNSCITTIVRLNTGILMSDSTWVSCFLSVNQYKCKCVTYGGGSPDMATCNQSGSVNCKVSTSTYSEYTVFRGGLDRVYWTSSYTALGVNERAVKNDKSC